MKKRAIAWLMLPVFPLLWVAVYLFEGRKEMLSDWSEIFAIAVWGIDHD